MTILFPEKNWRVGFNVANKNWHIQEIVRVNEMSSIDPSLQSFFFNLKIACVDGAYTGK